MAYQGPLNHIRVRLNRMVQIKIEVMDLGNHTKEWDPLPGAEHVDQPAP
jgi:hypothetical protein